MTSKKHFTLYNGVEIPAIGFGTWQIPNGKTTYDAVSTALKAGYRHIDTAMAYGNEQSVGKAVRDSGLERKNIFVTSKLPAEIKSYKEALISFEQSFENLKLEYLDLYLIHAPWPWSDRYSDYTKENIEVWKAMETFYKSGKCRAIGVSNFKVSDMQAIIRNCEIKPMANQIRFYIGNIDEEAVKFCTENKILIEGYSPFATGKLLHNEALIEMAKKYNCSVAELSLAYVIQRDVLPLPKSITPERIRQNFDTQAELSDEDMSFLVSMNIGR